MTMRYDPDQKLDVEAWLSLDEDERMSLVMDYHRRARIKPPNARLHAAAHTIVENQAALGTGYAVAGTLERLMNEGLDRHEAIHAIGSVLMGNILDLQHGRLKGDLNQVYIRELAQLSAKKWRSGAR
jgi:hypothetical protein